MMIPIEEVRSLGEKEAHVLAEHSGRMGCHLCKTRVSLYDMTLVFVQSKVKSRSGMQHVIEMVELLPLLCSYSSRC